MKTIIVLQLRLEFDFCARNPIKALKKSIWKQHMIVNLRMRYGDDVGSCIPVYLPLKSHAMP